jgi:hypothetical protein
VVLRGGTRAPGADAVPVAWPGLPGMDAPAGARAPRGGVGGPSAARDATPGGGTPGDPCPGLEDARGGRAAATAAGLLDGLRAIGGRPEVLRGRSRRGTERGAGGSRGARAAGRVASAGAAGAPDRISTARRLTGAGRDEAVGGAAWAVVAGDCAVVPGRDDVGEGDDALVAGGRVAVPRTGAESRAGRGSPVRSGGRLLKPGRSPAVARAPAIACRGGAGAAR